MLFCATRKILYNKYRSSALVLSKKVTFFLRILLKRTNTFKIAHLYEMSAGMFMRGKAWEMFLVSGACHAILSAVIKIMLAENKTSLNILNLYFRYT